MNDDEFTKRMERILYAVSSYMDPDMQIEQEEDKDDKDGDKNE